MGKYLKQYLSLFVLTAMLPGVALAETDPFKSTPYPVPRFVSLSSDKIHVRTGPGKKYPIKWVFKRKDLPVEVILEYEHWRKIKDHEGQEGWIYGSLLSGKRTALITGNDKIALHKKPSQDSVLAAYIEPLVVVELSECQLEWCEITAGSFKGWSRKHNLWGVYEKEKFN